jgi:hypothetical protein
VPHKIEIGLVALISLSSGLARGQVVAYQVPAGVVGNQSNAATISFGMDFNVVSPIQVTQIGVFDSGQDGLLGPLQAAIYDRSNQSLASPVVTFAAGNGAGSGTLNGGSRFLNVTPIDLSAGFQGTIVVFGYGNGTTADLDGNTNGAAAGTPTFPWTTDDGGGALSFTGSGRYSNGAATIQFPTILDGGPADRYAAGTFAFMVGVPEPASLASVAIAALVGLGVLPRRR